MADVQITASRRSILGEKVKSLRRKGLLPGNIYGPGVESLPIQLDNHSFERTLAKAGSHVIMSLDVEGESISRSVMLREIQRDPVTENLLHVEFYQVQMDHTMRTEVPLVLVGESEAIARHRGVLLQTLNSIEIECLPRDLPAHVGVDVSHLNEVGQSIHVSDLQVESGVTILTDHEIMVAQLQSGAVEAEEAAPVAEEAPSSAEAASEAEKE